MRVLHVINGLGTGGAERSLQEMLPGFHAMGLEPEIAIFHLRDSGVSAEVEQSNTRVHHLPMSGMLERAKALNSLIVSRRPAVVHTSLFNADIASRLGAAGTGVPVVTSLVNTSYDSSRVHDPNVNRIKLTAARQLDAFSARHLTRAFHAISPPVRDDSIDKLGISPSDVTVIPRGRSQVRLGRRTEERRQMAREKLNLSGSDKVIVNVGRQEFQKAQDVLLRAFRLVLDERPNARLLIAGRPGNASEELHKLVGELGLMERVRFLGHVEIPDLLVASDVFAFPSRFEGLGGSLIEALALEIPIVASDIPAIRYVLDDGRCGRLVPRDEPAALAAAVVESLDSEDERVGCGLQRFHEVFHLDTVTTAMGEWLGEMSSSRD